MEITPSRPSLARPASNFAGDVYADVIADAVEPSRIRVGLVRFTPGARTAWHRHANGQILYVTEGIGRVQNRGGEVREIRAGDTVYTPPGEWHWHGASDDHFMAHIAISQSPEDADEPDTDWGEHVVD